MAFFNLQYCLKLKKAGRYLPVLFLLTGTFLKISAQSPDYSNIFKNDWQKALKYLDDNNSWIKPALEKYKIPYHEAIAVVFPEIVRFSALRDKMETNILKTLYCNLGNEYANFSIGVFQIKPSFAEKIREEASRADGRKLFVKRRSFASDYLFRKSIVEDLEDPKTEINYLIAFFKICKRHFPISWQNEEDKIRFLATAYNTGFWKPEPEIKAMMDKKFFNTKMFKTENYSYADISLFWFKNDVHYK